jgi:hypothetical protein
MLKDENAKLQKVVDAARDWRDDTAEMNYHPEWQALSNDLKELDTSICVATTNEDK